MGSGIRLGARILKALSLYVGGVEMSNIDVATSDLLDVDNTG